MKVFAIRDTGPLSSTNRRVIWYETATAWPLKPKFRELKLSDVLSVDEGNIIDPLGGGALTFRLRNRKTKSIPFNGYSLGEWITAIRELIADAGEGQSEERATAG